MRKLAVALTASVVFLGSGAQTAHAATIVHCGMTVKSSFTLDRNLLNCDDDGLVVGASNITIDLGGFTLGGDNDGGHTGVLNESGFRNVTITNGTITHFDRGVLIAGSSAAANVVTELLLGDNPLGGVVIADAGRNLVAKNTIHDKPAVSIVGNSNKVDRNEIISTRSSTVPSSIRAAGDANSITRNSVAKGSVGVAIAGDRNVIDRNKLFNGARSGVVVTGSANKIRRNVVSSYAGQGVWVRNTGDEVDNLIEDNDVTTNRLDGVLADAEETQILSNDSNSNRLDGFHVRGEHSLVEDNDATGNRSWGVDANVTGIQGSDNDVARNGHSCRPSRLCA